MASKWLPGYTYDASSGRYRRADTGRFVKRDTITDLLETSISQRARDIRRGFEAVLNEELGITPWLHRTAQELKREHLELAALAAGGWDRLTPADYARIDGRLNFDFKHLTTMAREISEGTVSLAQGLNRLDMYLGSARREYLDIERNGRLARVKDGYALIAKRHLAPHAIHCDSCFPAGTMILCEKSWVPIEEVKVDDVVITTDGPRHVTKIFVRETTDLWRIEAEGSRFVTCTGNHPFLSAEGHWIPASSLTAGQKVMAYQDVPEPQFGQLADPNALDRISTSQQVSIFDAVSAFPVKLLGIKRLETGMPMPVIPVDFDNQFPDPEIADKPLDWDLGIIRNAESVQHLASQDFGFTGPARLADDTAFQQMRPTFFDLLHSAIPTGLGIFRRMFSTLIGFRRSSVNKPFIGFGSNCYPKVNGASSDLFCFSVYFVRALCRSLGRILFSDQGVFFRRPLSPVRVGAAPLAGFMPEHLAANFAVGMFGFFSKAPARITGLCLSILNSPTCAKIVGLATRNTEWPHAIPEFDTASDTPGHYSPVKVYNLEVAFTHNYIANGFFVHNCEDMALWPWRPADVVPVPTEACQCKGNCKCSIEYKETALVYMEMAEFNPYHDALGRFATAGVGSPDISVSHKLSLSADRELRVQTQGVFQAGWNAFKDGPVEYLKQQGFTEEEVGFTDSNHPLSGARGLIHLYSFGDKTQDRAMDEIKQHLRDNTRIGQVLRMNSDIEEQLYNTWDNGRQARYDQQAKEIERDFAPREKPRYKPEEDWQAEKQDKLDSLRYDIMEKPHYLYRLGKVGGRDIESWTTAEGGFQFDIRQGGRTGIGYTERKTIQQLHKDGYRILAGINLMSGAPGENEITFIRSSLLRESGVAEFNPYHDALGRFATGPGMHAPDTGGGGGATRGMVTLSSSFSPDKKATLSQVIAEEIKSLPSGAAQSLDSVSVLDEKDFLAALDHYGVSGPSSSYGFHIAMPDSSGAEKSRIYVRARDRDMESISDDVIHELGHHVLAAAKEGPEWSKEYRSNKSFDRFTQYALTNPHEGFAETYCAYRKFQQVKVDWRDTKYKAAHDTFALMEAIFEQGFSPSIDMNRYWMTK